MNCHDLRTTLPDLLLDPQPLSVDMQAHLDRCPPCGKEYSELRSTFALLDAWQAPEPSPYFDQKLAVRLREEATAAPAGWLERMRAHLLFNTGAQFRPLLAGAMVAALLLGGGAFAGLSTFPGHQQKIVQVSATVNDLQILDKNDKALQQMDLLLQDDQTTDDDATVAPRS